MSELLSAGELVSSEPSLKAEGWNNFYSSIDALRGKRETGAFSLLCEIHHQLAQPAIPNKLSSIILNDMELGLYSLDRPDFAQVHEAYKEEFRDLTEKWKKRTLVIPNFIQEAKVLYRDIARQVGPTTIQLDPRIPGELRNYGTRVIQGYDSEIVYASHTNVYMSAGYEMVYALSRGNMHLPPAYYGLSTGLDQVTSQFCQRYDQMPAPNLVEALKKEAYFQLVGTRALHPFWDGNGRAFGGFLAVALADWGIRTSPEVIENIVGQLSNLNDRFLRTLLTNSQIDLVRESYHIHMFINGHMRQDYMNKLSVGLQKAIAAGTDLDGPYAPLIVEGAGILKHAIDELQR